MKKCGIYKDQCKEWLNTYEVEKKWDNLKTHFIEAYFELKEDSELKNKHFGFV